MENRNYTVELLGASKNPVLSGQLSVVRLHCNY